MGCAMCSTQRCATDPRPARASDGEGSADDGGERDPRIECRDVLAVLADDVVFLRFQGGDAGTGAVQVYSDAGLRGFEGEGVSAGGSGDADVLECLAADGFEGAVDVAGGGGEGAAARGFGVDGLEDRRVG